MSGGRLRRVVRSAAAVLLAAGSALAVGSPAGADSIRNQQWYLSALGTPAAQAVVRGDGVTVAVIDTGVAANQPDLAGSVLDGLDATTGGGTGHEDVQGRRSAGRSTRL